MGFFDYVQTEIVCERKVTEDGLKRVDEARKWLNEILSREEVFGVVGWIQGDCEDPTDEEPMFVIYVKKGMIPVESDDPFEVNWFYCRKGVKNKCPGMVWHVEEVDEMLEFLADEIGAFCWCCIKDSLEVWRK